MDYHFVTPDKLQNLNQNYGDIFFRFQPNEDVNFFEASLVVYVTFNVSSNKTIPTETKIPKFKKFFIYNIFNELELFIDKKRFSHMQYIYEYVKATQNFANNPKDKILGFKEIQLGGFDTTEKLIFNIPLRILFPEFKGLNYVDSGNKELNIKLQRITNDSIFTDLNDVLTFNYEIEKIILKIPQNLQFTEEIKHDVNLWKASLNVTSVSHMIKAGKGDLHCFTTNDRPLIFSCFFYDQFKNICNGIKSIILILNNKLIPHLDLSEETNLEHYYEMYLRYVDFLYGSFTVNHHEKLLSVLSFDEFSKNPIYFFILPKIKETGHYDIKLKIVFEKINNKIEDIFYMYNFLDK